MSYSGSSIEKAIFTLAAPLYEVTTSKYIFSYVLFRLSSISPSGYIAANILLIPPFGAIVKEFSSCAMSKPAVKSVSA